MFDECGHVLGLIVRYAIFLSPLTDAHGCRLGFELGGKGLCFGSTAAVASGDSATSQQLADMGRGDPDFCRNGAAREALLVQLADNFDPCLGRGTVEGFDRIGS